MLFGFRHKGFEVARESKQQHRNNWRTYFVDNEGVQLKKDQTP